MDQPLKHRLIGAAVFLLVAGVLSPMLFDAEGRIPQSLLEKQGTRSTSIVRDIQPQPMVVEPLTNEPAEPAVASDAGDELVIEPDVAQAPTQPTQVVTEAAEPTETVVAWSVQVASFKDSKKADELRVRLLDANFRPYIKQKRLSDGTLFTQVFIGPESNRAQAEKIKDTIKTDFQLQGLVVRFSQ